jgi:Uma2 family endonuclease
MTVGNRHALAIGILTELNARLTSRASYMRIQLPITVVPDSEPEPDGCIVRGAPKTYRDGHPEAKDICCVIEAAESSLAEDRGRKQRIYANAGIRQYVILNLVDNVVEEYTQPEVDRGRYAKVIPFSIGQQIELQTATQPLVVSISELLG